MRTDPNEPLSQDGTDGKNPRNYVPNSNRNLKNDILWQYFDLALLPGETRESRNPNTDETKVWRNAICNVVVKTRRHPDGKPCGCPLSRKDGNTSSMRGHLKSKHPKDYAELELQEKDLLQQQDEGRRRRQRSAQELEDFYANREGKVVNNCLHGLTRVNEG